MRRLRFRCTRSRCEREQILSSPDLMRQCLLSARNPSPSRAKSIPWRAAARHFIYCSFVPHPSAISPSLNKLDHLYLLLLCSLPTAILSPAHRRPVPRCPDGEANGTTAARCCKRAVSPTPEPTAPLAVVPASELAGGCSTPGGISVTGISIAGYSWFCRHM